MTVRRIHSEHLQKKKKKQEKSRQYKSAPVSRPGRMSDAQVASEL